MFSRKIFPAVLLTALMLFSVACGGETDTVQVLHFNDFHAQIKPFKKHYKDEQKVGGVAHLVTKIKQLKNKKTMVLLAGDAFQGTPFSTVFKGEATFRALNGHLDAMILGNHEFDYGQDNLRKRIKAADFPVINGNVYTKDGKPFTDKAYMIKKIGKAKIGIFGLVTKETAVTTHPKNVKGLVFKNEIPRAKELVKKLKAEGATVIIALTHLGFEDDKKLAKNVAGIDVIIGGHSHTVLKNGYKVNSTLIAQAGYSGMYLGKVDISVDSKSGKFSGAKAQLVPISPKIKADPQTVQILKSYKKKLDGQMKQVIGKTTVALEGSRKVVRNRETNLGNVLADILKNRFNAQIAFLNGGGIRASIDKGDITVEEVLKVLPFGNGVTVMKLSGKDIRAILSKSAAKKPAKGNFIQVSEGFKYEVKNKKLVSASLNGKKIEDGKMYKVVTSDFLAAGGDGFTEFKNGKDKYATGQTMMDAVVAGIKEKGTLSPKVEGRITIE